MFIGELARKLGSVGARFYLSSLLGLTILGGLNAKAANIEFPEEELASESVLPVFDNPTAVKKRNIVTENHLELGLITGLSLNDPFFSPIVFGGLVTYHLTEEHGIQLLGMALTHTASQYDDAIKKVSTHDFSLAPSPSALILAQYEFSPFYGKASFSKQVVFNQSLNVTGGAGVLMINGESDPAVSLGIGQKLYLGHKWGLRLDLRSVIYNGPYVVSGNMSPSAGITSTPANSYFQKSTQMIFEFTGGFIFLL